MGNKIKVLLIIVGTMLISIICTGLGIEYLMQRDRYGNDVIQSVLVSGEMGEDRKVVVHLPENYREDTENRYPVMYILDGTSQDIHTSAKVDLLSKVGILPESIVVGIPNTSGNRSRDFTPHYMKIELDDDKSNFGNGNRFLMFLEKELIPYINDNFRTNGFNTLSGNSRGGLFALYALMEKPELFDGYLLYSPAFWREDLLIADKLEQFIIEYELKDKYIFMSLGDGENEKMNNGFKVVQNLMSATFSNSAKDTSVNFISEITVKAIHGNNAKKSTVYALKYLGEHMRNMGVE